MSEILLDKKFMAEAERKFREAARREPDLAAASSLPDRWNFHKQKIYLTNAQKTKFQMELSKMTKAQIRKQIEHLKEMEKERMEQVKIIDKSLIALPNDEKIMQETYKWAFYCREAAKFADYYLRSLEYQKKI